MNDPNFKIIISHLLCHILYSYAANDYIVVEIVKQILPDSNTNVESPENLFQKHKAEIIRKLEKKIVKEKNFKSYFKSIKDTVFDENSNMLTEVQDNEDKNTTIVFKNNLLENSDGKKNSEIEQKSENSINNTNGTMRTSLDYNSDIIRIATDKFLFNTLINNLDYLNRIDKNFINDRIKGISVYKDGEKYTDFWRKLEFNQQNGIYIDKTGFFEGVLKNNFNELVKTSKIDKTGFNIDQNILEKEEEKNVFLIKKLILEISKLKNLSVDKLWEGKLKLGIIDEILMNNLYPLHDEDMIDVCVCKDKNCSDSCTEVRKVERKQLRY